MYTLNRRINNLLSLWLITMFWIVSIMIIVGGLTRLTDSGLSITEWELFSGFFPPLDLEEWNTYFILYQNIPEFKLQNYDMTIDEFKVIFLVGMGTSFSWKINRIRVFNSIIIFFF